MALAYFALSKIGLAFLQESSQVASIWPASGLALAAFVVLSRSWWPWLATGIAAANFVAQQLARDDIAMNAALALVNAAEPVLAATVLLAVAGRDRHLQLSLRAIAGLLAAVIGANAVTAALGAAALSAGTGADYGTAFAHWWLADGVGMLALAPLALLAGSGPTEAPAGRAERVLLLTATTIATYLVFSQGSDGVRVLRYAYLVFPFVIIPALRLPSRMIAVNLAIIVAIIAAATASGTGPFVRDDLSSAQETIVAQGFIAVVAILTLLVAAVVRQSREAAAALAAEHAAAIKNEARYRLLADHTADMITVHAPDGPASYVSPSAVEVFGIPAHEAVGVWAADLCHPRDRSAVEQAFARSVAGEERVVVAYRVPRGRGWRWLETTLRPVPGDDGGPAPAVIGSTRDVTVRVETEAALRASEELHRVVLDHLPDAIVTVYDQDLRILAIKGGDLRDRGITPAEIIGRTLAEASPADAAILEPELRIALTGEERTFVAQASGTGRYYEVSLAPYRGASGEVAGVISVSRDVTARHQLDEHLRHLADHDPLTGLPNRRRFDAELGRHTARLQRYGLAGAVLLVDLDNFKSINDTLGHAAGDDYIIRAGKLLRSELRDSDLVARIGGDEFAILLPQADAEQAVDTARRLVAAVQPPPGAIDPGDPRMTFSIGVAAFACEGTPDPEAVMAAADRAMYEAKAAGRNRACVSEGLDRPPAEPPA
jgi:diguanylate cyclase (GGDEF)-like protein/PAS domain S-box-containing protein